MAPPTISLPKGGGAIRGIGEKFAANPVTGTSTIGYWQISSDANGQTLVAGDYPMDAFTFKVTKGQYLTLRGVTVSLQE